jgi:hypothetical protein
LSAGGVLCHVGLVRENTKVRHHKPESHQRDASAYPSEKRSLFGEIISQINRRIFFDWGIHFASRNAPVLNVFIPSKMLKSILLSLGLFCGEMQRIE